jgi:uncharacterized repeat protein (TIGR01451 family)
MNTKQFLIKSGLALICVMGLLSIGLWAVSTPQASTTGTLFPFYSPIPPLGEPQITLVKTVDNDNPTVDDEITYTLTYHNANPGTQAFNVRLYDFIPAGVQFISSNPAVTAIHNGALLFAAFKSTYECACWWAMNDCTTTRWYWRTASHLPTLRC